MGDWLRAYWDFGDVDASEARFRALLATEADSGRRAEILTQLARVHGLRSDFEEGERLIGEAETQAGESAAARVRIDLERGRLRRSSGDKESALPLFESAFDAARAAPRASSPRTPRTWPPSPRPTATASSPGRRAGSSSPRPTRAPATGSARC